MSGMEFLKKLETLTDYQAIINEQQPFQDKDFPAGKGILGKDYDFPFKSANDRYGGKEVVYNAFDADDIIQGYNGDCYYLSAIAALSEFPNRVEKLFEVKKQNKAGCYAVELYVAGYPTTIVVDDYFAFDPKANNWSFAGSKSKELWVMILEKAWAKVHGNFTIIDGGDGRESLGALTGAPVEKLDHESFRNPLDLWKEILNCDRQNFVMCTGGVKNQSQGIESAHAYTLTNAYEVKWNGQEVRLLQVRNPWGSGEWKGDWADNDQVHWTPELNKQLNHVNKDDGTFFISFEDFIQFYRHTFVAKMRDEYVHSHAKVEKAYACAAFKVMKKMKGYASAYQMTSRLVGAATGTRKTQPLSLELFKFTNGAIKPTGLKGNQNAIGFVHVQVELEPGTYLIEAKFTGEPNLIPFISLAIYADQAVDIMTMNVKNIKEVTHDMVEKAFSTVKTAYTFSNIPAKMSCNYTKCTNGHLLVWGGSNDPYDCEGCREKYNPGSERWICGQCNYDICPKCKPKEIINVVANERSNEAIVKCRAGHVMKFGLTKNKGIHLCDKCGKAYQGSVERWNCEECSFDLCRNCLKPPADFKPSGPIPEITTCSRFHNLFYLIGMVETGTYNCDFCSKIGDPNNGRWYCGKCNFNVCPICIPHASHVDVNMNAASTTTQCTKGHTLRYTSEHPFDIKGLGCDKCRKLIQLDTWRWNCPDCHYDICLKCRPAPQGRTDLVCNKRHLLTFSRLPIGTNSFTRCDRCHKTINVTNGRYCCGSCQFDLCPNCEPLKDMSEEERASGATRAECNVLDSCKIF